MSLLAIYLRDHHTAAVAGTRLARRVANVAPRDASGGAFEGRKGDRGGSRDPREVHGTARNETRSA